MEDIRRCAKCHRAVAVKYFNEDCFLCKECYENKRQSEDKAGIPPLAPPPLQQITPVAQPISSPTQSAPPQAPAKSSAKLYLALAIALLVIVVLGVKMFLPDSAESAVEVTEKPVTAQTEDNVQSQEPQKKAEQPVAEPKAELVKKATTAPLPLALRKRPLQLRYRQVSLHIRQVIMHRLPSCFRKNWTRAMVLQPTCYPRCTPMDRE